MRRFWISCIVGIIALGILSRVVHTGAVLFDKYLGDVLYAAMVYAILRLWFRPAPATLAASAIMLALELFQLTGFPSHLLASEHTLPRVTARLLGTSFSWADLLSYAMGIASIRLATMAR